MQKYIHILNMHEIYKCFIGTLHSLPLFYQLRKMMSEMTIEVTFQIKGHQTNMQKRIYVILASINVYHKCNVIRIMLSAIFQ